MPNVGPRSSLCLYSTIRNISGTAKIFGFLPPHGRPLANNEEFTVFGNILEALGSDIGRSGNTRARIAFEKAIERGDLEIVHTPNPILESYHGLSRMLELTNAGTLAAVAPCWTESFSHSDSDVVLENA